MKQPTWNPDRPSVKSALAVKLELNRCANSANGPAQFFWGKPYDRFTLLQAKAVCQRLQLQRSARGQPSSREERLSMQLVNLLLQMSGRQRRRVRRDPCVDQAMLDAMFDSLGIPKRSGDDLIDDAILYGDGRGPVFAGALIESAAEPEEAGAAQPGGYMADVFEMILGGPVARVSENVYEQVWEEIDESMETEAEQQESALKSEPPSS